MITDHVDGDKSKCGMDGIGDIRIGIISQRNIESDWASTHCQILRSLRAQGADPIPLLSPPFQRSKLSRALSRIPGARSAMRHFVCDDRRRAAEISRIEGKMNPDVLVGLHCSALGPFLKLRAPLAYVTDATPALMRDYYASHRNLSRTEFAKLDACERVTLQLASQLIVPSEWVARSIRDDYGVDSRKVHVIEWGANCDDPPPRDRERLARCPTDPVHLLFVGLDWHRKGGDLAVAAAGELIQRGRRVTLSIVGAEVPVECQHDWVHLHGKLSRAEPGEARILDELFYSSDLLLHPARAECYGHVLCEAQAYGLPIIATDTGGIPQCVADRVVGCLLDPACSPNEIADRIEWCLTDEARLRQFSDHGKAAFANRLNWRTWAARTLEQLVSLVRVRSSA